MAVMHSDNFYSNSSGIKFTLNQQITTGKVSCERVKSK